VIICLNFFRMLLVYGKVSQGWLTLRFKRNSTKTVNVDGMACFLSRAMKLYSSAIGERAVMNQMSSLSATKTRALSKLQIIQQHNVAERRSFRVYILGSE